MINGVKWYEEGMGVNWENGRTREKPLTRYHHLKFPPRIDRVLNLGLLGEKQSCYHGVPTQLKVIGKSKMNGKHTAGYQLQGQDDK